MSTSFPRVTIAAQYLNIVSHSGEFTIITRDAIGNSARSSVWRVPRSGEAGREAAGAGRGGAIAVLVVTNSTSRLTCHR